MQTLMQDVRFAWRSLRKSPGFTLITILTLALGIGANSAIFSVINGVLLKPLPYPDPDRLYWIFLSDPNFPKFPLNPNDFMDYRSQNRVFETIAAFTRQDLQLSDPDRPERWSALRVSKGYFEVLGFRPELGRTFDDKDELKGNAQVVILSDSLWRRRFNADRGIIGRKITLDEQPYTVVGVMPAAFQHVGGDYRSLPHGNTVDAWWPFTLPNESRRPRLAFPKRRGPPSPGHHGPDRASGHEPHRR
jgi:MacB-like periplasmic core domain